jgi:predicted RNA-binding protein with PUA-like domain
MGVRPGLLQAGSNRHAVIEVDDVDIQYADVRSSMDKDGYYDPKTSRKDQPKGTSTFRSVQNLSIQSQPIVG